MNDILQCFERGGSVMAPIVAVGAILFALLAERAMTLARPGAFTLSRHERERGFILIRALIGVAPLLGLLGTVNGVAVVLTALTDGHSGSRIGAGIGEALITTQFGLAVAVPALLIERFLSRRCEALASCAKEAA